MSETAEESWDSGGAYELWVGRWSRKIAEEFIAWLAIAPKRTWGDVGCGTGARSNVFSKAPIPHVSLESTARNLMSR